MTSDLWASNHSVDSWNWQHWKELNKSINIYLYILKRENICKWTIKSFCGHYCNLSWIFHCALWWSVISYQLWGGGRWEGLGHCHMLTCIMEKICICLLLLTPKQSNSGPFSQRGCRGRLWEQQLPFKISLKQPLTTTSTLRHDLFLCPRFVFLAATWGQ